MAYDEDEVGEFFKRLWKRFDEVFSSMKSIKFESPEWHKIDCIEPLMHVYEDEENIIVTADMPKVNKEDIKVNADTKSVQISARLSEKIHFQNWSTVQRKSESCRFQKIINLPMEIIPDQAKAEFKKGILIVKLPKKKEVFSLKIE
jgi:HSP20 family protein